MARDGEIDTDVNRPLWRIGWHWAYLFIGAPVLGIALGYFVGGALGFAVGLLTVAGGPVFALSGLVYVHVKKDDVIRRGTTVVEREAAATVQRTGDTETHSLLTTGGKRLPLLPKPNAQVATLIAGDDHLLVHSEAEINLPSLTWRIGNSTNEYHYDRVAGVNYDPDEHEDGGTFWVNFSDGQDRRWDTMTDADGALQSVQNRIRAYNSQ
ncbi:hypothetical protein [Halorubrum lipolyticum]|uniref:Uncharacterized protein n=1 Tax=Halorubrum lipolyticum DSM 21995 TaxID=1227482 RepID=M0NM68_9EURY|nr:hypothetical protein [Halorubrum lipolyticum]EMA58896.1 hypothetical protein C469_12383 [Halorubrum lipolyticum DSM 21995]